MTVALAALGVIIGFGFTLYNPPIATGSVVALGSVESFPAGSITEVEVTTRLEKWVPRISANAVDGIVEVAILVVSKGNSEYLTLYVSDPHLGCRVRPASELDANLGIQGGAEVSFINPCHGEKYDLEGRYLVGPSQRGLDRFGSSVRDGVLMVDLTTFTFGPSR